jgi:hypothetical protein
VVLSQLLSVVVVHDYVIRHVPLVPSGGFAFTSPEYIEHVIIVEGAMALTFEVLKDLLLLSTWVSQILSWVKFRPIGLRGLFGFCRLGRLIKEQDMSIGQDCNTSNVKGFVNCYFD